MVNEQQLAAACRPDSEPDQRLRDALAAGAQVVGTSPNEASGATDTWPRRVRHLAHEGLLLDDETTVLRDLAVLAAEARPYIVVISKLQIEDGEQTHTALLTDEPAVVRVTFAHSRAAGVALT